MASLADTVIIAAREGHRDRNRDVDLKSLALAVAHAARYRVDHEAECFIRHIANQMSDKPQQIAQTNMPSGLCFFEFPWADSLVNTKARTGFLWIGRIEDARIEGWTEAVLERCLVEGSTNDGTLVVCHENHSGHVMFTSGVLTFGSANASFLSKQTFFRTDEVTASQLTGALGADEFIEYMDSTGLMAAATGAVLTSPKVIDVRPTNYTRLNAQRQRRGKEPLLEQRDVILRIPKPEQARRAGTTGPDAVHGSTKVRHMVSLFTRLKGGKIEVVSPHWRGDASKGIKMPSYFAKGR